MPIIPQYQQHREKSDTLNGPRYNLNVPSEAFGSSQAKALSRGGESLQRAGDMLGQRAMALKAKNDDYIATDLLNQAREAFIPEYTNGLFQSKGKDALELYEQTEKSLPEFNKRFLDQAKTPSQREMLEKGLGEIRLRALLTAASIQAREGKQFGERTKVGVIASVTNESAANYQDVKLFRSNLGRIEAVADELGRSQMGESASDADIAPNRMEHLTSYAGAVIEKALADEKPEVAKTLLEQVKGKISQKGLEQLEAKISEGFVEASITKYESYTRQLGESATLKRLESDENMNSKDRRLVARFIKVTAKEEKAKAERRKREAADTFSEEAADAMAKGDLSVAYKKSQQLKELGFWREANSITGSIKGSGQEKIYWNAHDAIEKGQMTTAGLKLLKQVLPPERYQKLVKQHEGEISVSTAATKEIFKVYTGKKITENAENLAEYHAFHDFIIDQVGATGRDDWKALSEFSVMWNLDRKEWFNGDFSDAKMAGEKFEPNPDYMPLGWEYHNESFVPTRPEGVPDQAEYTVVQGSGRGWLWQGEDGQFRFKKVTVNE